MTAVGAALAGVGGLPEMGKRLRQVDGDALALLDSCEGGVKVGMVIWREVGGASKLVSEASALS